VPSGGKRVEAGRGIVLAIVRISSHGRPGGTFRAEIGFATVINVDTPSSRLQPGPGAGPGKSKR